MMKPWRLYTDGAARGNPGPAGAGAVLYGADGEVLGELCEYLGETTNNVAEYRALLLGLKKTLELGGKDLEIHADSELMVRQLQGEYRVKNPGLKALFQEAIHLLKQIGKYSITHVRREENEEADKLANRAIDEHT